VPAAACGPAHEALALGGSGRVKRFALAVVCIAAVFAVCGAWLLWAAEPARRVPGGLTAEQRKELVYAQYEGVAWPKLGAPQPGQWLAAVDEPGQTYEEYIRTARNLKSDRRTTIYLQPLGPMTAEQAKVIEQVAEFGRAFFACTVTVLEPAALPGSAYVPRRRQYHAGDVLDRMARHVPDDALAYVGVTAADLYGPRLDFAFGLASLRRRVAIVSFARYGEPSTPEFLRRLLRGFAHETGHVFGLRHCIFYECCMNGSDSIEESDGQPLHYCPLCHDKLRHALAFEPRERFEHLAAFYDSVGFTDEAQAVRRRLAQLTSSTEEEP
jgi:archaemetzincin